jgi:hypothetical protein
MHRHFLSKAYLPSIRTNRGDHATILRYRARYIGEYESKYAQKLRQRAEE